jgi:hypothetical protein
LNKSTYLTVVAISALLLFAGCGKSKQSSDQPRLVSAEKDPLGSFKGMSDRCRAALVDSDRVLPGLAGGFVRTVISTGQMSYDVTKTDSLVSPYAAFIKLSFLEQVSTGPTEAALRDPSTSTVSIVNHWKLMYALQDGKWKFQQALYSPEMPALNIVEKLPAQQDVKTLFSRVPGAEACLPV